MKKTATWWTTVSMGNSGGLPFGPWRSRDEAEEAVDRWRHRRGADAGSYIAASNARIVGPFPTRRQARHADISDHAPAGGGIYPL